MKLLKQLMKLIRSSDSNPGGEIQHVLIPGAADPKVSEWSPWKPFPNVKDFKVELQPMDELFAKFGIVKRLDKASMVYTTYENKDINRYVLHQIRRLKTPGISDRKY